MAKDKTASDVSKMIKDHDVKLVDLTASHTAWL